MSNTITLFASSRRNGNTGSLIDRLATEVPMEIVDLAALRITPHDYGHQNREDDFESLMDHILRFDQIIFSSPVYWYAVTPQMKAFIDRLNDLLELADLRPKGRLLRTKRAFIVATSGSQEIAPSFLSMFTETFAYLGMGYGGSLHVNCDDGFVPARCEESIRAFAMILNGIIG